MVEKYAYDLGDCKVECVVIPNKDRLTFCVSTQAGCPVGCKFCMSGKKFIRNLTADEIVGQVYFLEKKTRRPYSLVYMGTGEPMLNLDNVIESIKKLNKDYNFSEKKITVSTSILGNLKKLKDETNVQLAISLHFTENRKSYIPVDVSLEDIKQATEMFPIVMIEYMMLDTNDSDKDLRILKTFNPKKAIFNLIEYNGDEYNRSKRMQYFKQELIKAGFKTFIRESRGSEINAACGQLTI